MWQGFPALSLSSKCPAPTHNRLRGSIISWPITGQLISDGIWWCPPSPLQPISQLSVITTRLSRPDLRSYMYRLSFFSFPPVFFLFPDIIQNTYVPTIYLQHMYINNIQRYEKGRGPARLRWELNQLWPYKDMLCVRQWRPASSTLPRAQNRGSIRFKSITKTIHYAHLLIFFLSMTYNYQTTLWQETKETYCKDKELNVVRNEKDRPPRCHWHRGVCRKHLLLHDLTTTNWSS